MKPFTPPPPNIALKICTVGKMQNIQKFYVYNNYKNTYFFIIYFPKINKYGKKQEMGNVKTEIKFHSVLLKNSLYYKTILLHTKQVRKDQIE